MCHSRARLQLIDCNRARPILLGELNRDARCPRFSICDKTMMTLRDVASPRPEDWSSAKGSSARSKQPNGRYIYIYIYNNSVSTIRNVSLSNSRAKRGGGPNSPGYSRTRELTTPFSVLFRNRINEILNAIALNLHLSRAHSRKRN